MEKLSDEKKLSEIEKRIRNLNGCSELLVDSINQDFDEYEGEKYRLLCDWFDKYLWKINGILGYYGDNFEL